MCGVVFGIALCLAGKRVVFVFGLDMYCDSSLEINLLVFRSPKPKRRKESSQADEDVGGDNEVDGSDDNIDTSPAGDDVQIENP